MATVHDLGIEGATVVTSGRRRRANVYVSAGRVAEVTEELRAAERRVDAGGLLLMPGMVDAHVHFMDPSSTEREDFPSGSAAALRAGVTTVLEHTHSGPVRSPADLAEKARHLAGRSHVDFGLGAHAWPGEVAQARAVWEAGASFVKAFTCTTHGVPGHDPAQLQGLLAAMAEVGGTCLLHCEDEWLTAEAERALRAAQRSDGAVIPAWRNPAAEITSATVASILARATGARTVIAHVSHAQLVSALDRERRDGGNLWIETCPQYLTLLEREVCELGALRKFTPPARAQSSADLDAMWSAVARGPVDYISTDHAPSTREQKAQGSIWDAHFGLPGIDTTLPVLLDGARAGHISYERVVELYSTRPAEIYGLNRKGYIATGADADLVLVDPAEAWTVRDEDILSKAGWSPFSGRRLVGRPVQTYLRGTLAMDRGSILVPPGTGAYIAGPGALDPAMQP